MSISMKQTIQRALGTYGKYFAAKPITPVTHGKGGAFSPTARAAAKGKAIAAKYFGGGRNPTRAAGDAGTKSAAELQREINEEIASSAKPAVLAPSAARPSAPFPGPRTTRQTRASAKKSEDNAKRTAGGRIKKGMTRAEFLAALPDAIDLTSGKSGKVDEVPKQIRRDFDLAIEAGLLPEGAKISVTKDHYASFRVKLTEWPLPVFNDKFVEHHLDATTRGKEFSGDDAGESSKHHRGDERLTRTLNDAMILIDKIAERSNYNHSDLSTDYFDVGYYVSVSADPVISAAMTGLDLESNKEYAALYEQALKDARALGPACVKSVCGNKDLKAAGKYCMERLRKIAERAKGRPVEYDKSRNGWFPVDERTASLPTIQLGKQTFRVASGSIEESTRKGIMSLIGKGGGNSSLIRPVKDTKDQWAHQVGSRSATWYQRKPDGTFELIR